VHPNTAQYRLRRVEERTGRNPRRIADLLDLLVAIELRRDARLDSPGHQVSAARGSHRRSAAGLLC
jgi:hypothetical protein